MKKIILLFLSIFLFWILEAQNTYPAKVSKAEFLGRSRPLKDIPIIPPGKSKEKLRQLFPREVPNFTLTRPMPRPFADVALPRNGDSLARLQANRNPVTVVKPDTVWEGIGIDIAGVFPPDPVADASPDHIIQMTNTWESPSTWWRGTSYVRVYDKAGTIVLNIPNLNSFWSEFNVQSCCDPVVLWDQEAERWIISEISDIFSSSNSLLIAVSETSDPLGSWVAYRFQAPGFPDYPKYGVWHNAYVVTINEFGNDITIPVYALEREAMLAGLEEVKVQRLGIPKFGSGSGNFQAATPIDFDGFNPPPPGSPAYVVRLYDDAWEGGQDKIELWEVHVDWLGAGNSFLSGPTEVFCAPFESRLCEDLYTCVPQPNGVLIDAIQEIILHRASYLNFGSYEAILLHFAVDIDGNHRAGLRWMELRRDSGSWYLYQEGTYAPDDGTSRFVGGIAMDYAGNILMAYSATGPNTHPSLRLTGRYSGDPLGVMTLEEYEFGTGLSSQDYNRWGDYASMSIDPANGQDFWFTGEYMKTDGNWGTKIMKAHLRRDSTDAGPWVLLHPKNSAFLTDAEPVQVAIRNYGLKEVSNLSVSYSVDGEAVATELITETLAQEEEYWHTFSSTANLEALGAHDFLIFTSLEGDSARFNDTLRTTVFQLPRRDAVIIEIKGLEHVICDTSRLVDIILANAGADTLFSTVLSYQLNESPAEQANWAGNLAPGEQEAITITLGPLDNGDNTFFVAASLPNGLPDENPDNDSSEQNFTVSLGNEEVVLQLVTDEYPEETAWELRDEAGNLLYSGGPYSEGKSLIEEHFCIPDACYTLTLFDTFGDGLAGLFPGSFQIVDEEGRILTLLNEINFGDEITLVFCSRFECQLTLSSTVINESTPGAGDGQIFLSLNNALPPLEYSIDGGATFQPSPEFSGLAGGSYSVIVRDANLCEADTILQVSSCNLMASAEVSHVSEAGQHDGRIVLQVSGGLGPYAFSIDGLNFQPENIFEGLAVGAYEITIRDEGTACETSLSVTVDPPSSTGSPRFFGRQVKLSPNPTEGYVRVEILGAADVAFLPLRVLDGNGQVVRHGRLVTYGEQTKGVVSLYGLPAGVYYLQFQHGKFPAAYAVMKQ